MISFVDRKFVIYVGTQTINGILFERGNKPKPFAPYTLEHRDTQRFFETGRLNNNYVKALISAIMSLVDVYEYGIEEISIYVTSEFRTILDENELIRLKGEIFSATGVHSFILSDELENLYIKNLVPACDKERLILRIMSTSTNMYCISENGDMVRYKVRGVGTSNILSLIPGLRRRISEQLSDKEISGFVEKIKGVIVEKLKKDHLELPEKKLVIYLGGEIDFLKALSYELENNQVFEDCEHPYLLSSESFFRQSREKVLKNTQKYLNGDSIHLSPKWKTGMKPCTLIAMALFELLSTEIIIPSNMKEFYGMHYKNFESVVITGSKRVNGCEIAEWVQYFKKNGVEVYSPQLDCDDRSGNKIIDEMHHLQAINKCDTLIACNSNEDGYLGDATLFDIGYAMAKGKRVITTKKPSQDVFNLIAVEIGVYRKE